MRIYKAYTIVFLALLCLPFLPNTFTAMASPGTVLYVDPSSIVDPDLAPSTPLSFMIKVTNVTDLYAWQIKLYYNPTLLNWTGADYPPGHVFFGRSFASVNPTKDTDPGGTYILFFASLQGDVLGIDGSGTLCRLNFTVLDRGISDLRFSRPLGYEGDTWLLDHDLNGILFEGQDGYVSNKPATPPAALSVDPAKKVDPTLVPSTNFTIDVNIKNATALRQCGLELGFDPTLLNAINATLGPFLPPTTIYTLEMNNTGGYVKLLAAVPPSDPAVNGNGTLVHITFHVESLGFCDLTLFETSLTDDFGDPIPHSTSDGYFNNVMLAKIAVQPPEIRDPSLLPPQTFEINITIAEVQDLYGYEFKLGYNPAIIVALQVTIHDMFGEAYYTPSFSVDNLNGIVWINVTYFEPANPISTIAPETAVTIRFRVRGIGITPLDLYDTSLTDSSGQPIAHEAQDGLFASAKRDIAVINVVPDQNETYQGWTVYINVTAENQGDLPETFEVKVYYGISNYIGSLAFVNVNPNETATQTIPWNTKTAQACENYTIWAEAVPLPYEQDLGDNTFTDGTVKVWLMGDINHDCKVDGKDLAIVSKAFASYPGHPRWDPAADLNRDGKIDGKDIAKIAANFGTRC